MKSLDAERLRKFPGLERPTDDEAKKITADLYSLSIMLIQSVLNDTEKFEVSKSKSIGPEGSDNQRIESERKKFSKSTEAEFIEPFYGKSRCV
jgi:hypothetical protein